MPSREYDYCALQFLNQWMDKERHYCDAIASQDIEEQRQGLKSAAGYFKVARNLPKVFEEKQKCQRYDPVLDALNGVLLLTQVNVTKIVDQVRQQISKEYGGRDVLSLTTKFLWLKFKAPVRIYDSQARAALGTPNGDYEKYITAFSERFTQSQVEIMNACNKLTSFVSYSVVPNIDASQLEKLVAEQWFQERVLDIYLWNEGRI